MAYWLPDDSPAVLDASVSFSSAERSKFELAPSLDLYELPTFEDSRFNDPEVIAYENSVLAELGYL